MKQKLLVLLISSTFFTSCSNWSWSPSGGLKSQGDRSGMNYRFKLRPGKGLEFGAHKEF